MFTIKSGTEIKQWSQGNILVNPCMNVGDRVFFRGTNGSVYIMLATAEGVEVPNILLQMAKPILVDLEDHKECRTRICVTAAEKPDDYTFIDNVPTLDGDSGGDSGVVESLVFRVEIDTKKHVTITPIEEILSAYESGKLLYIQELGTGTSFTNFLARVSYNYSLDSNYKPVNSSLKQFEFCSIVQRDGSFQSILINADGTIDVLMKDISYVNDWQPS